MERSRPVKETVSVSLGVPFHIPDTLQIDPPSEQDDDITEIGSINLEIEGLGKVTLDVIRLLDDGEWSAAIRTPLGSITTTQIRNDGSSILPR